MVSGLFGALKVVRNIGSGSMIVTCLLVLFMVMGGPLMAQQGKGVDSADADEILIDATYVPCSDSTESFFIFQDGRVIYAWGTEGIVFSITGLLLDDLKKTADTVESTVDTTSLDSCTTVGAILSGPRYLLMNASSPSVETTALCDKMERIRKYARKKMERGIDKLLDRKENETDTNVRQGPSIAPDQLQQFIYDSPIAQEWRCRGKVVVTARVDWQGRVRQAFVHNADVKGKCSSLLTMTALRAVLLSTFQPAIKGEGKQGAAWLNIEVTFGRRPWGKTDQPGNK